MISLLILPAIIAVIIAAFHFGLAYLEGTINAEYPSVAKGDYRNGMARKVYLLGLHRGAKNVARDARRRALTLERRNEATK